MSNEIEREEDQPEQQQPVHYVLEIDDIEEEQDAETIGETPDGEESQ